MIYANPTPKGTGIELWGDHQDLTCLYDSVCKLAYYSDSMPANAAACERNDRLLSIISYEIRKAFKGQRMITHEVDNGVFKTTYYGFRVDWITLLYSISSLRYNAGYTNLDNLDLSNLLILEYWTKSALNRFDKTGAANIELFINSRIDITTEYVYLIHQRLIEKYFSQKPTKKRFRSIPSLLTSLTGNSLTEFISEINTIIQQQNCSIHELEFEDNDTPIIW